MTKKIIILLIKAHIIIKKISFIIIKSEFEV